MNALCITCIHDQVAAGALATLPTTMLPTSHGADPLGRPRRRGRAVVVRAVGRRGAGRLGRRRHQDRASGHRRSAARARHLGLLPRHRRRQLHDGAVEPRQAQRRHRPRQPARAATLLYELVETRRRLPHQLPARRRAASSRIDVEDIRARQPEASSTCAATARARAGPTPRRAATTPRRSGRAAASPTRSRRRAPPRPIMQRAAFGDSAGGMTIAGGIAAALFRRERTGEPSVVDVSLLGTAMWILAPDIVMTEAHRQGDAGLRPHRGAEPDRQQLPHQGRPLALPQHAAARPLLGRPLPPHRPRRPDHRRALRERHGALQEPPGVRRASSTASSRRARSPSGATRSPTSRACGRRCRARARWATIRRRIANGYLPRGRPRRRHDVHARREPGAVRRDVARRCVPRPSCGQHTEEVLLSLGLTWEQLAALKESGAIS